MSKNVNMKDEVVNEVNETVVADAPVEEKKLTLAEKAKPFGRKVKKALPYVVALVVGGAIGFVTNAFLKEGDDSYVPAFDVVEEGCATEGEDL